MFDHKTTQITNTRKVKIFTAFVTSKHLIQIENIQTTTKYSKNKKQPKSAHKIKERRQTGIPLGPRVTPTALASFSTPAWRDDLEIWSKAMSLAAALTTSCRWPPDFCPGLALLLSTSCLTTETTNISKGGRRYSTIRPRIKEFREKKREEMRPGEGRSG